MHRCSLPLLGLALQQTDKLASVNLSSNNVTGSLDCSSALPAIQELDLSNNK